MMTSITNNITLELALLLDRMLMSALQPTKVVVSDPPAPRGPTPRLIRSARKSVCRYDVQVDHVEPEGEPSEGTSGGGGHGVNGDLPNGHH